MAFTLQDLGMAYRKAKVDVFYSNDPRPLEMLDYETDLESHLTSLLRRINGRSKTWVQEPEFLGDFVIVPKEIEFKCLTNPCIKCGNRSFVNSSPSSEWASKTQDGCHADPRAVFRAISHCSIDFHVLSALWITYVGVKLDQSLSDSAFANRLRRTQKGEYNTLSAGSFKPYLPQYRQWRDRGLNAMVSALDEKKKVIAITADATAFFHRIDAQFLSDERFLKVALSDDLSRDELKLHKLFVSALNSWSEAVADKLGLPLGGLPVALPASGLIANLALIELDKVLAHELKPLYYGRYVDDIILVMEGDENLSDVSAVWEWIQVRTKGLIQVEESDDLVVRFKTKYLEKSCIEFENKKNKIFYLEGASGRVLVDSIRNTAHERSSEWRALPTLPHRALDVATSIVEAAQADGDASDSIRKTERLSASRGGFALKLRDLEAYARDLSPDSWEDHRKAFYQTMRDHMLVLPRFFELAQYLPRVLRVAVVCGDWDELISMVKHVSFLYSEAKEKCIPVLSSQIDICPNREMIFENWGGYLRRIIEECLVTTMPTPLEIGTRKALHMSLQTLQRVYLQRWPSKRLYQQLQLRDLAAKAFRELSIPAEMFAGNANSIKITEDWPDFSDEFIEESLMESLDYLVKCLPWSDPKMKKMSIERLARTSGMMFPTRPFGVAELFAITNVLKTPELLTFKNGLEHWLRATRGFSAKAWTEMMRIDGNVSDPDIRLPNAKQDSADGKLRIALGSVGTSQQSLTASIHGRPDLTLSRYQKLVSLINSVLALKEDRPHYLVLPELSIPAPWFLRFANKLAAQGTSFIAGIEYLHSSKATVCNQTWASLVHDGLGFPTNAVYRQDKLNAAPGEETNLWNQARLELEPAHRWQSPPIISHGRFKFAMLVCYELTNIDHRAALRGKVDALVVPEWNQDLHTFDALVESAALDIHAYIVQVNNRVHGDSRIRAPRSDVWERDIVRLRGGMHDHFVVGEIDILGIREFQTQWRMPHGKFKALPDGYDDTFDVGRQQLPKIQK